MIIGLNWKNEEESIDDISCNSWKQFDNELTHTLKFVFCDSPSHGQTLKFNELKNNIFITLTDNTQASHVSLFIDFDKAMLSKVKTFKTSCIMKLRNDPKNRIKLLFDTLEIKAAIPFSKFDFFWGKYAKN